jgi:hypothetical protein
MLSTTLIFLMIFTTAQAQAQQTNSAAEHVCDCELMHLVGSGNPASMTVWVPPNITQVSFVDLAGLDPITAGDDDQHRKILCACHLTKTAGWNLLGFESTKALQEELSRRDYEKLRETAKRVYENMIFVLECIHYFFTTVLPQKLVKAFVSACVHAIHIGVRKAHEEARVRKQKMLT